MASYTLTRTAGKELYEGCCQISSSLVFLQDQECFQPLTLCMVSSSSMVQLTHRGWTKNYK